MITTGNRNIAMMIKIGENLAARRCAMAVVLAGTMFALTAGSGTSRSAAGGYLQVTENVPNFVWNEHALFGICITASALPAITFFIGVVALSFYGINEKLNLQIQDELAERRKSSEYS